MSFKKLLGASLWKGLLLSMLLLLLLLAAASLMLQRGMLPESAAPVMVCTAYAASVFVGARQAVRGERERPDRCRRRWHWLCCCTRRYG